MTDDTPTTLRGYDAKKVIELMMQPLPDAAYKQHPTKDYQTTISPDYTRERLTKIFGLFGVGWGLSWNPIFTKEWMSKTSTNKERYNFAFLQAEFWFKFGDDTVAFSVVGSSNNDNLGDAMKGARTSCISDGAKQLLFQLHIYKNTPYSQPAIAQDTGEVIKDEKVVEGKVETGGQAKAQPPKTKHTASQPKTGLWPATSGPLFEFCQRVRASTPYYGSQWHLSNSIGIVGDLTKKEVQEDLFQKALAHANEQVDIEAAKEEQ